ncbi:MAG: hypothetical protein HQ596_00565 [Candidatus Saganbacteria bacterium]|nr:hypothetical protein [Candidatus Saganbacteria bacterium]
MPKKELKRLKEYTAPSIITLTLVSYGDCNPGASAFPLACETGAVAGGPCDVGTDVTCDFGGVASHGCVAGDNG